VRNQLKSLFYYEFSHLLRAKWLPVYGVFFFIFTAAAVQFGRDNSKAVLSLLSLILLVVPAVSTLYATIYKYNSESYTNLLLTQPLKREAVYLSAYLSTALGLSIAFTTGTGLALAVFGVFDLRAAALLLFSDALTFIFVAIGMLLAVSINDRMKGIGAAVLIWIYFAVLHDAIVFAIISSMNQYPIEVPSMLLMASNPIDLTRVSILLMYEAPAMMGYTGRILQSVLSGTKGLALTSLALCFWALLPMLIGKRKFRTRDL
jgi:Cu-processing system permease protein